MKNILGQQNYPSGKKNTPWSLPSFYTQILTENKQKPKHSSKTIKLLK